MMGVEQSEQITRFENIIPSCFRYFRVGTFTSKYQNHSIFPFLMYTRDNKITRQNAFVLLKYIRGENTVIWDHMG